MACGQESLGTVGSDSATRRKAFTDAFVNAQQKFARQPGGRLLVFFNLAGVDVNQIPIEDEVKVEYCKLVEQLAGANRGTSITLCYDHSWKNPVRHST